MNTPDLSEPASYALNALCILAGLPVRTVRYYVQLGLVDRPDGGTRAARYGARHLEQLLLIKKWTNAGLSLDRIRDLLAGETPPVAARPRQPGAIHVCSHLAVTDGVDLVIEPIRAGLSPEQVRRFATGVMALYQHICQPDDQPDGQGQGQ